MQFAVPQFTEVEDKLIGPLTLKQFLFLLGFAGIIFFFWSILGTNIVFLFVALPIAGVGVYVTFKKYNGRPFFTYLLPLISYLMSPKVMIFTREAVSTNISKQPSKIIKKAQTNVDNESAESRLKKLSYLLDQKFEEEKELIAQTQRAESRPVEVQNKLVQVIQRNMEKQMATQSQPVPQFTSPSIAVEKKADRPKPAPKKRGFNPDDILKPKV